MSKEKKETKTMPVKPTVLELEEAEMEIFASVEKIMVTHNLPFFLLEPIVNKLYQQISNAKANEINSSRYSYEQQLKEAEEQNTEEHHSEREE